MRPLAQQVQHDAASLEQFISSIADQCVQRTGAAAYPEPSERFFSFIVNVAASTRKYLEEALASRVNADELLELRADIELLRGSWRFLHRFVKPVLDADTLRLPTSMVQCLTSRFCEIPHFKDTDFVVYHTDPFNYFNVKLAFLKSQIDKISAVVGGPSFPDRLGLVEIPYSQASSVFMNCLIPHELGHYAFGELRLRSKISPLLEQRLISEFGASLSSQERLWLVDRLAFWSEEIFCDLFAVRMVGFCFAFAFVELFDVATVLDETSTYSPARALGKTDFSDYPPDLFRLGQQVNVLQKDGWWDHMTGMGSHYVRVLEGAVQVKESQFGFPELASTIPRLDQRKVLGAFFAVVPTVHAEMDQVTVDLKVGTEAWKGSAKDIKLCLRYGIVPSALNQLPTPISLLNASYEFYLEELDFLLDKIKGADKSSPFERATWTKRVESWVAKAIEDVSILERENP